MAQSREPSLPSGMSDLVELIEQSEKEHLSERMFRVESRKVCRVMARHLFDELFRSIDHDLLFTDQPELVMPLIRQASWEAAGTMASERLKSTLVDMLTEETWTVIVSERIKRQRPA